MKFLRNPIAFRPTPVTTICSIVYIALIVLLLVVHHTVPEAPERVSGVNVTEAWLDLQDISNGFHPYNSHRNDKVREWLLKRIKALVLGQDKGFVDEAPVVVFSDTTSNLSFSNEHPSANNTSVYFEGTNIIVYIRGSDDEPRDWLSSGKQPSGGVLVNAHYDSVSTGYGATDDGVGVVTILQLIRYFSSEGRQPRKGIIALFNNGEEDYLNGARAFSQHPTSKFPRAFLNLEGAGAGGRAALFRSTDTEVTRFYQKAKEPFGSVLAADGFKMGLIKSETDYSFFNSVLGMRGLDVAFMEPRARYHTDEDDTKHTNQASLYHMLSSALAVMQGLSADTSDEFKGKAAKKGQVSSGKGSYGVWFDLFGSVFAVFQLHTLYALCITLLVVAPLTLVAIGIFLHRTDKLYLFSAFKHHHNAGESDAVGLRGLRGIFRWPIAFVLASAAVIGLAFLVSDINPYISYSSPYAIWSMMISTWLAVAWGCLTTADIFRPTALQRTYALLWMFLIFWIVLILATILEQKQNTASAGYLMFFYFACIYLATTVSTLQLFGLPRKSDYAAELQSHETSDRRPGFGHDTDAPPLVSSVPSTDEQEPLIENVIEEGDDAADESTSLLRGSRPARTTFKRYSTPHQQAEPSPYPIPNRKIYAGEQPWSHSLPSSLWVLEHLLLAPIPLILLGQVSLLINSGIHQLSADGNSPLQIYLFTAILSILLFLPLTPHLHRFTYHIPLFLFLVFMGTLIYNLLAFPFSSNNRLKLFFQQTVNLDTGANNVSLTGIGGPYLLGAIASLPSAAGQTPTCNPATNIKGLTTCHWTGLFPHVVPAVNGNLSRSLTPKIFREAPHETWFHHTTTLLPSAPGQTKARFHILPANSRACKIRFQSPISDFHVLGSGPREAQDKRFRRVPEGGSRELRLWTREWGRGWVVDVTWPVSSSSSSLPSTSSSSGGVEGAEEEDGSREREGEGRASLKGEVVCLWSDANEPGVIPALDEVKRFAPAWVAVTTAGDCLVEGVKGFVV